MALQCTTASVSGPSERVPTLGPVFAAIFSVWLAGDRLSSIAWLGGVLIVAGMIFVEAWPLLKRRTANSLCAQGARPERA